MITLVTGSPGHGKSYAAVRKIDEGVSKGIPIATNVPLREDWAEVMARNHTFLSSRRPDVVAEKAARYRRLVFVSNDLNEIMRVRFQGDSEGRGWVILDEAHRWMNTRAWDQSPGLTRSEAIAQRLAVVGYCSAHRHYGADVWLISQDAANIDSQVRSLYEFHTETRNMKRTPFFSAVFRFNLFLVTTHWNDKARSKAGVTLYGLNKQIAALYHTHALQYLDWPDDAIVLPYTEADAVREGTGPYGERSEPADPQPEPSADQPDVTENAA